MIVNQSLLINPKVFRRGCLELFLEALSEIGNVIYPYTESNLGDGILVGQQELSGLLHLYLADKLVGG